MRSIGTLLGKGKGMPVTAEPAAEPQNEIGLYRNDVENCDFEYAERCDQIRKTHYSKEELVSASSGTLFGKGSPMLPSGPLLTLDRVLDISATGGDYNRGYAIAEWAVDPSLWFFKHHFKNDPVVPGTLLLESLWQLTGFYLAWSGYKGCGRVVSNGRSRFLCEVKNEEQTLTIKIHIRKVFTKSGVMCVANGKIYSVNSCVCDVDAMNVALAPEHISN